MAGPSGLPRPRWSGLAGGCFCRRTPTPGPDHPYQNGPFWMPFLDLERWMMKPVGFSPLLLPFCAEAKSRYFASQSHDYVEDLTKFYRSMFPYMYQESVLTPFFTYWWAVSSSLADDMSVSLFFSSCPNSFELLIWRQHNTTSPFI